MSADIFVSHANSDEKAAKAICSALEIRGHTCWLAKRDVGPGESYMAAIVRAIRGSKVMVLVFSDNANRSEEIIRELALASQYKVYVIPARLENVLPVESYEYAFAARQWIDLFEDWEGKINELSSWISRIAPLAKSDHARKDRTGGGRISNLLWPKNRIGRVVRLTTLAALFLAVGISLFVSRRTTSTTALGPACQQYHTDPFTMKTTCWPPGCWICPN